MKQRKRVGIVFSGSGWLDGSEIHEATLTLLYLDQNRVETLIMAPDKYQMDVVNHIDSTAVAGEKRNVLVESARIARGNIQELEKITPEDLDALILPGGFGAMKNLCDYAVKGSDLTVNSHLEKLLRDLNKAGKPTGFICIAPMIAAKVFGDKQPRLTIGKDMKTASTLEQFGARHVECKVEDVVVDESNKIVSTPAYMLGPSISFVAKGIEKLVKKVVEMA